VTVIDAVMDRLDPIPSDLSWEDIPSNGTVCMECGTVSGVETERLLSRHVICQNPECDNEDGYVFSPYGLPVVSVFMALLGSTTAYLAGYPGLWLLGVAAGLLVSLYSGTAKIAHRGGI